MGPLTQPTCKEFYLRGTKFRIFGSDHIVTVYNEQDLTREQINSCIRYMILESLIEIGTYQVNVYS